jgi:hypothetical protein
MKAAGGELKTCANWAPSMAGNVISIFCWRAQNEVVSNNFYIKSVQPILQKQAKKIWRYTSNGKEDMESTRYLVFQTKLQKSLKQKTATQILFSTHLLKGYW